MNKPSEKNGKVLEKVKYGIVGVFSSIVLVKYRWPKSSIAQPCSKTSNISSVLDISSIFSCGATL